MRFVPIHEIRDNMVLAKNVQDEYGRTIITAGSRVYSKYIPRLKNFGIYYICISDDWSDGLDIEPQIEDKTITSSIQALEALDLDKIFDCASAIVDELCSSVELMYDFETLRDYDENTYHHSVNVAINAVTLGIGECLNYKRLNNLAVGAMLHDIGKQKVPLEILNKAGKLNDEEMEIIRRHPEDGYKMLNQDILISASIKEIVHQHHENWDGTGYPRGLKEKGVYDLAAIVHICDVYDALISKRAYKEAFTFSSTIDILRKGNGTMFSPYYLRSFFKYVPIYHKGTEITLSNSQKALVIKNNRGDMLRPQVRLKDGRELDLRETSLSIIS